MNHIEIHTNDNNIGPFETGSIALTYAKEYLKGGKEKFATIKNTKTGEILSHIKKHWKHSDVLIIERFDMDHYTGKRFPLGKEEA
tara:strand:+ start:2308 stop:2562 length:255 start_codon:yes stop_codon:yes gene_type:complete